MYPKISGGDDVNLRNHKEILKIDFPRGIGPDGEANGSRVEGPYEVVCIPKEGDNDRWAIVALDWCDDVSEPKLWPRLALRWFYKEKGYPFGTYGTPQWMVLPNCVSFAFLDKKEEHNLSDDEVDALKMFLNGEIDADKLKEKFRCAKACKT